MFNAGQAQMKVRIESPAEVKDAMGAPKTGWLPYAEVHAGVENREYSVADSLSTGPRRESAKNMTLIVRNHVNRAYHTNMRAVDVRTGEVYAITSIRYGARRDVCYMDVTGGVSDGE